MERKNSNILNSFSIETRTVIDEIENWIKHQSLPEVMEIKYKPALNRIESAIKENSVKAFCELFDVMRGRHSSDHEKLQAIFYISMILRINKDNLNYLFSNRMTNLQTILNYFLINKKKLGLLNKIKYFQMIAQIETSLSELGN